MINTNHIITEKKKEAAKKDAVILLPEINNVYYVSRNTKIERVKVKIYHKNGTPELVTVFAWVTILKKYQRDGEKMERMPEIVPAILENGVLKVLYDYADDTDIELFDEKLLRARTSP